MTACFLFQGPCDSSFGGRSVHGFNQDLYGQLPTKKLSQSWMSPCQILKSVMDITNIHSRLEIRLCPISFLPSLFWQSIAHNTINCVALIMMFCMTARGLFVQFMCLPCAEVFVDWQLCHCIALSHSAPSPVNRSTAIVKLCTIPLQTTISIWDLTTYNILITTNLIGLYLFVSICSATSCSFLTTLKV